MKTIKEYLKEGKEDLPKINKLKKERTKLTNKQNKVSIALEKLEMSLSKYMDMDKLTDKDRKAMRSALSKVTDKEDELEKVSIERSKVNKELKTVLGL